MIFDLWSNQFILEQHWTFLQGVQGSWDIAFTSMTWSLGYSEKPNQLNFESQWILMQNLKKILQSLLEILCSQECWPISYHFVIPLYFMILSKQIFKKFKTSITFLLTLQKLVWLINGHPRLWHNGEENKLRKSKALKSKLWFI